LVTGFNWRILSEPNGLITTLAFLYKLALARSADMANKVGIVIDSTAYIPDDLTRNLPIQNTPVVVIWEGEELLDGVDIQPAEFYERLKTAKEMPTTSQPSPAQMLQSYEKMLNQGYDILGIFVTGKLSGTMSSATQAKEMLPNANIEIVDSYLTSMGAGWQILKAAKAAAQGASLAECKQIAEQARAHSGVLFMVDTLEFLHRGGRIGTAKRFIGTALNVKPILEFQDGVLEGLEQVRTEKKAMNRLLELLEDRIGGRTPVHLGIMHANVPEKAQELLEMAKARMNFAQTTISPLSPALGVQAGPGTLGFCYMAGYE
jgi:DegV family protein with EDD domain